MSNSTPQGSKSHLLNHHYADTSKGDNRLVANFEHHRKVDAPLFLDAANTIYDLNEAFDALSSNTLDAGTLDTATLNAYALGVASLNVGEANSLDSIKPLYLHEFFAGLAQLTTISVFETFEIIEAIHREAVLRPIGRFNKQYIARLQQGIMGRLYNGVRNATLLVGQSFSMGVEHYTVLPVILPPLPLPATLKTFVSMLNGVMGDHLVADYNVLALPMRLYDSNGKVYHYKSTQNKQNQTSAAAKNNHKRWFRRSKKSHQVEPTVTTHHSPLTGRVVILIHGLCMSHAYWQPTNKNSLGQKIVRNNPKATILYLDYNTGQRISTNGRILSHLLQDLIENNPNISQIDLIGHSMGGLVARSALFYGQQTGANWMQRVQKLITLGTPHHGSALERIGYILQESISELPFAGSLSRLADIRSAGIIDLRHGSIREEDWRPLDTRSMLPDIFRHPTKLPDDIHTYFIAGTLFESLYDYKASHLIGDGLVTVASALGEHTKEHSLFVPEGHKAIFYGISHQQLIHDDRVHQKIIEWLNDDGMQATEPRCHDYSENFDIDFN